MGQTGAVVPLEKIEQRIFTVRAQKVMLDSDLADLYGVTTKRLNEQVRRNRGRFPADFMFRLTKEEAARLRSQNATSIDGYMSRANQCRQHIGFCVEDAVPRPRPRRVRTNVVLDVSGVGKGADDE